MTAHSSRSSFHSETCVLLDYSLHLTLRQCLLGASYMMYGDDSCGPIIRPNPDFGMMTTLFIQNNIFKDLPTEKFVPYGCGKLPQSSQQQLHLL